MSDFSKLRVTLFALLGAVVGLLVSWPIWFFMGLLTHNIGAQGRDLGHWGDWFLWFSILGTLFGGVVGGAIGRLDVRRSPGAALGGITIGGFAGLAGVIFSRYLFGVMRMGLGLREIFGAIIGGAVLTCIQYKLTDRSPTKPPSDDELT